MKKRFAAAFLLAGFAVGVIAGVVLSKCLKKDGGYFFLSTFFIDDITDKGYDGEEYYITILLDDSMVEGCRLTSDTFSIPTTKSIHDQVALNVGYLGVSVEVTLPEGYAKTMDMGYIFRENLTEYCKITKVMATDMDYY